MYTVYRTISFREVDTMPSFLRNNKGQESHSGSFLSAGGPQKFEKLYSSECKKNKLLNIDMIGANLPIRKSKKFGITTK